MTVDDIRAALASFHGSTRISNYKLGELLEKHMHSTHSENLRVGSVEFTGTRRVDGDVWFRATGVPVVIMRDTGGSWYINTADVSQRGPSLKPVVAHFVRAIRKLADALDEGTTP